MCSGTAGKYTRSRWLVEMIYKEFAGAKFDALKRELQIKALPREKKPELIGKQ